MFAYTIKAELNNDGSYKVTLFDVDDDESPIEDIIPRARITIDVLDREAGDSDAPLLTVTEHINRNVDGE